jgi:hypothetical protein
VSLTLARSLRRVIKWYQSVEGEKTGDPLKARATTFYDPVHNALDKEAQCAWPSVYIQKPFMTL